MERVISPGTIKIQEGILDFDRKIYINKMVGRKRKGKKIWYSELEESIVTI